MNIAFVGIRKDWRELEKRSYLQRFVKYHLELPWYYGHYGDNDITIVTEDYSNEITYYVKCITEDDFISSKEKFDVVVHWRKWFEDLYRKEAVNVLNSQDHSYSDEWKTKCHTAFLEKKLSKVLCFQTWHERNFKEEMGQSSVSTLSGVTLGVDTEVYHQTREKNRYDMLWASDPGRGLIQAVELAISLYKEDKRYKLHVCYPDYVDNHIVLNHPALVVYRCIENGQKLWSLFNRSTFLPYTSTFKEPSSRAHRQAQAAGCVVMYPDNMGSPSELITNGEDGIVCNVSKWKDLILGISDADIEKIANGARLLAEKEDWRVQARRFKSEMIKLMIQEQKVW